MECPAPAVDLGRPSTPSEPARTGQLGLWDTISIIVGIVVGTAVFKSPSMVFQSVSGPYEAMFAWSVGGFLSLLGALCYAELASTYPQSGGDYQYLRRAYGNWIGFLFGWAQLSVVLTGSIGAMAFAFAEYFAKAFNLDQVPLAWLAVSAIVVLSVANMVGVMLGKSMQNLLSVLKVVGLLAIVLTGVLAINAPADVQAAATATPPSLNWGLAMVFVLYAYGGWNDAAFVAAEVRNPRQNIPRALLLSTAGITIIYLMINATYLGVLGFHGARQSWTPAADVLARVAGPRAGQIISLLIVICTLGAINGLILTGSRMLSSLGEDHRLFESMGRWHPRWGTPARAILIQGLVAVALVLLVGTDHGRRGIDSCLIHCGLTGLPWAAYFGGFETLVSGTAPVFWLFFLLTGIAQFVLRCRDRDIARPFVTPWYPIPPIIFCLTSAYMLYASLDYARGLCLIGVVPLLVGVPLYACSEYGWIDAVRQWQFRPVPDAARR